MYQYILKIHIKSDNYQPTSKTPFEWRFAGRLIVDKVRKKAMTRNRYNQVPHLTQDTTWESDKTQESITYKRAKMLALFQQVTTRLQ